MDTALTLFYLNQLNATLEVIVLSDVSLVLLWFYWLLLYVLHINLNTKKTLETRFPWLISNCGVLAVSHDTPCSRRLCQKELLWWCMSLPINPKASLVFLYIKCYKAKACYYLKNTCCDELFFYFNGKVFVTTRKSEETYKFIEYYAAWLPERADSKHLIPTGVPSDLFEYKRLL